MIWKRLKKVRIIRLDINRYRKICKKAVEHYGEEAQKKQAIEECSELIQALCKDFRNKEHNVEEEIADVMIMLEQLTNIYDMEEIDKWLGTKIDRLNRHIDEVKQWKRMF
jgi:NTP pyrophosphatase (non-canonical NTP hydrolase)